MQTITKRSELENTLVGMIIYHAKIDETGYVKVKAILGQNLGGNDSTS